MRRILSKLRHVALVPLLPGLLVLAAGAAEHAAAEPSWSGVYGGFGIARRIADATWETTCVQDGFPGSVCPDAGGLFADRYQANNPVDMSAKRTGWSAFAGAQTQLGPLVAGVEGDYVRATTRREIAAIPGVEDPATALSGTPDSASLASRWEASVRARAGILLLPTLLAYGTAGPAWTELSASAHCGAPFPAGWCSPANVGLTETVSTTLRGWTWGGGLEALLGSHFLLRGEYRVSHFGGALGHTFLDGRLANADAFTTRSTIATRTFMLGVGYKF